jgi:capsular polysaccharide biosynthesis protein
MFDIKNMNNNFIEIALKNFKLLFIVGAVAAILSVVLSSPKFIEPKFQSQAIVYPSNLQEYSEESPIEQMMQWFESVSIKDKIIEEYNLAEHYDIEVEKDKLGYYYLLMEYDENISINETKYESAEISVIDTDPEMAFKITNSIIKHFNDVVKNVHRKRADEDLKTASEKMERVKIEMDSVIRKLNIMDGIDEDNKMLSLKGDLSNKSSSYILYSQRATDLNALYQEFKIEYHDILNQRLREMTYTNVVTEPYASYKKVYPVRWLILVISTFSAIFFTFIVLLFSYRLKNNN